MKVTLKTVLCLSVAYVGMISADMASDCNMAGFYLELGCEPERTSAKCPEAFNCPPLHPDPKKCYYRGEPYDDKSTIPQDMVKNPCSIACSCRVSGKPRFECAAVDCVETFDTDIQQQCISTYELDSCCSTGTLCGNDAIAKLKTCDVEGKTYYEFEQYYPANSRKVCICTGDFDGNLNNPKYCRDLNCGIEIHYQEMIADNCAPVFADRNASGCPIGFQCPSSNTKVGRGLNIRNIQSKCMFGNFTLSVGDAVTVEDRCINCFCKIPPFVSCERVNDC